MQERPNRPSKRQLSQKQLQRLRRRRRQERIFYTILSLLVTALIITAAVLALKPEVKESAIPALKATVAPYRTIAPMPTIAPTPTPVPTPEPTPVPTPVPTVVRSVRLRAAGEITATDRQLKYAATGDGSYDFTGQLAKIAPSLRDADYTLANIGTTLGMYKGRAYTGSDRFNSPDALLDALKNAGVDMISLANDHMLDRWFDGMKNTIAEASEAGLDHVGAYATQEDRDAHKIVSIGGIRFGFLAYTQSTNDMEKQADEAATLYGVPYLLSSNAEDDSADLRRAGAEVVIVLPHWGEEDADTPDDTQLQYARAFALAGADVVLGSNPAAVHNVEYYPIPADDGSTRYALIAYSLGSFLTTDNDASGMILDFTVSRLSNGSFRVESAGCIPTYCWEHDGKLEVVPSVEYAENRPKKMDYEEYSRMTAAKDALSGLLGMDISVIAE